jgi:alpha-N-arabinofuranosidase
VVNGNGTVSSEMNVETLPQKPWPALPGCDDFDGQELSLVWNFIRNPKPGSWSLSERPGYLRLWGNEHTLDSVAAPAFVGRRQEEMSCVVRTVLDFSPSRDGEEAGLSTYMSETHHYEIAITKRDGLKMLVLRRRMDDLQVEVASVEAPKGPVTLKVSAMPTAYAFSYAGSDGIEQELGTANIRQISVELAGIFTGMYFGLYATGNGANSTAPADFDLFELRNVTCAG